MGQEGSQSQEVTAGKGLCLIAAGSENGELSAFKSQLNFWDLNIFFNVFMPKQILSSLRELYPPHSKLLLEKDREPSALRDPVTSIPVLCLPAVVSRFAPETSALTGTAERQQRFPAELSSNGFLPSRQLGSLFHNGCFPPELRWRFPIG